VRWLDRHGIASCLRLEAINAEPRVACQSSDRLSGSHHGMRRQLPRSRLSEIGASAATFAATFAETGDRPEQLRPPTRDGRAHQFLPMRQQRFQSRHQRTFGEIDHILGTAGQDRFEPTISCA
jgi:hypothetical protein